MCNIQVPQFEHLIDNPFSERAKLRELSKPIYCFRNKIGVGLCRSFLPFRLWHVFWYVKEEARKQKISNANFPALHSIWRISRPDFPILLASYNYTVKFEQKAIYGCACCVKERSPCVTRPVKSTQNVKHFEPFTNTNFLQAYQEIRLSIIFAVHVSKTN